MALNETEKKRRAAARATAWNEAHPERRRQISREWARRNYQKRRPKILAWAKAHPADKEKVRRFRARRRAWMQSLKSRPCMDCGGTFPPCAMDFDHRDPSTKLFNVGTETWRSPEVIEAEIAKCDIICANCHRVRSERAQHAAVRRKAKPAA